MKKYFILIAAVLLVSIKSVSCNYNRDGESTMTVTMHSEEEIEEKAGHLFDILTETKAPPEAENPAGGTQTTVTEPPAVSGTPPAAAPSAETRTEQSGDPIYRVRTSWKDIHSQKGSYTTYAYAVANCPPGYYVFDENGNALYAG